MIGMLIDTETGDLQVKNGTLVPGDTTEQVATSVLLAARGEFKEYPLIGAEIYKQVNGNADPMWLANARQMLQACGVPVRRVVLKDNQITIE
ncbi:MAG: hypothetical protein LBK12_08605 [Odoribacteraceae bacterium]|jgi:hypothetical protein|nr:hypothetical protein [Odoribacteraceae bacterium]